MSTDAASRPPRDRKRPELFYTTLHDRNVNSFKLLVDTVLPVRYPEDVYKKLISTPGEFTKLAYFNDSFVACIGCRLEGEGLAKKLYIMVLAVLAPYRNAGIGSEVLETVLEAAAKHPEISEIYLHVHTGNEEAQRFYKRFGFEVGETVPSYYRGIMPPDAFVMRKVLPSSSGS